MKWAVTWRLLLLLLLPCVYFQAIACGGATAVSSSSTDSDGSNSGDDDNSSDNGIDPSDDVFDEDAQFKSFSVLLATLETFQTMEAQYLVSTDAPQQLLYTTSANCSISGETVADSSLLDFNSCVVDVEDVRLLLSGDITVTAPDSATDVFSYNLGVEVINDEIDYIFGIEGSVTKTQTDSGDDFEFDIDTSLENDNFGINGSLTLENDLFTGSLSLLYNTLLASCSFHDFIVTDFETFTSFCEF